MLTDLERRHMISFREACHGLGHFLQKSLHHAAESYAPLSFVLDTKTWQQLVPADGELGFQGYPKRLRSFCGRSFSVKFPERSTELAKLHPVADTRLYRDPYCNGI